MERMLRAELIEEFMRAHDLSKHAFCKMCKICPRTLRRIMNNEDINLLSIFKVAKVMQISVFELFY